MTVTSENYSIIETHPLEVFTIDVWDNGIINIQVQGNTLVELKHVKEQHEFFKQRYDQKNKFLVLVESGNYSTITKEAREYSALPETNAMVIATAVIVKSLAERLIANFIVNLTNQQEMQMQLFECRQKAIKWLESLREKEREENKDRDLSACC